MPSATTRQARGPRTTARQARELSAAARVHSSLGGGGGGTQIFNIKKKISKRNIPNFFACHDGRKCLNYFDLVRAESSLVISFQNLMCWHNLT